jgi:hypothetical protein
MNLEEFKAAQKELEVKSKEYKVLSDYTNNLVFKPQDLPKKFTMQERRLGGKKINYNFVSRVKWKSFDWNINQIFLVNTHSRLHYLACHSPTKIQQRYKKVYTLL